MKNAWIAPLALACAVSAPAAAQVATVPVHSMWQSLTGDVVITSSVSIYGYTSKNAIPRVLRKQAVNLGPAALLQPEFRAEFPGFADAEMVVMQLIVKSNADAPTFSADTHTVTPKTPLAVKVPPGKKLWVVYSAPVGQPGKLKFYVGSPPPTTTTSTTGTTGGTS